MKTETSGSSGFSLRSVTGHHNKNLINQMANDSAIIGIDLGTTYCCIGFLNSDNHVEIIENQDGYRTTPSYVAFTDNDQTVGLSAKDTVLRNPKNVIYDTKRLIGRRFDDKYLQQDLKTWPFVVSSDANNTPLINILQKDQIVTFKPHEISAIILKHMKTIAEQGLEKPVTDAVITVPAYFNYHQRIATKEAGKLAGLNILRIINEPTAAALAYIHKHKITDCKSMVIFDLGGGTFDVSVLKIYGKTITIRATSGNTHLGGRDFDTNLANFILEELKEQYGAQVADKKVKQRVYAKSEKIKIKLSTQKIAYFDSCSLLGENDVNIKIYRKTFEKVNMHLFRRCIQTVENCLKDAKVDKADVQKIVLVGGSTRIPKLQEMLQVFFDGKELSKSINPDEAVAYGAAVQAASFNRRGGKKEVFPTIIEVTPLSLGTDILGDRMSFVIPRNTPIPITKTLTYLTTIDKQGLMCFNIYEGERSLVKYNTKLGTTTVKLPRNPPGYPVDLTFHIDDNGILEAGAKTQSGAYASMAIDYNRYDCQKTNDALQDAQENKLGDRMKYDAITHWSTLNEYCTKLKALCSYSKKGMHSEEKCAIMKIAGEGLQWLENNRVENGDVEEIRAIAQKQKLIQEVCEPIANKYGYKVLNMPIFEFYNLLSR